MEKAFEEVLDAAKAGDTRALGSLWRRWQPALLRYLRAMERSSADDIASETWLTAARTLHKFHGDENAFTSWLFTIARRRLIDSHRRNSVRPQKARDIVVDAHEDSTDILEDVVARFAAFAAVDFVRTALPPDQAEVVLLNVVAGLNNAQVADVMGRSPGATRVLLHRGLRKLATLLPAENFDAKPHEV